MKRTYLDTPRDLWAHMPELRSERALIALILALVLLLAFDLLSAIATLS